MIDIYLQHGSDSGVFDREGRFVPQAFEDMFAQIDKDGDGAFSFTDLRNLVARNRLLMDPFGVSSLALISISADTN